MADVGRVDFDYKQFEFLVRTKGVRLYHEKGVRCGCVSQQSGNPLPNCVNCLGVGFQFLDGQNIKGILQSVNKNPKYTTWSEVDQGTAQVTVKYRDRVSWMDRLSALDGESTFTETVYVNEILVSATPTLIGRTTYDILNMEHVYRFDGVNVPQVALVEGTDYTIANNRITLVTGDIGTNRSIQLAVRYRHRPQYIVMDLPKDIRNTRVVKFGGVEARSSLPVMAIIRKCQYVLGSTGITGASGN